MSEFLKNSNSTSLSIVYANWPEGYVNQRFIDALVQKYKVSALFFDETDQEIFRTKYPPINIPSDVKKITVKDPPLIKIPLNLRLATKSGSVGLFLKIFMRALIFRRNIRRLSPDLLIGNGVSGTNPYGLCGAFSGFHPFVVLVWGSDILVEAKNSLILRMIARFVLRRADGVIVDSEVKTRAAVELGCSRDKIWKFPWGIDLDLFKKNTEKSNIRTQLGWENNKIIISTRNHFPIYGVEFLIRSIPHVIKEIPSARFLIVGDGPNTCFLKEMAKDLGIQEYVNFTGRVPNEDLPRYIKAADLYVSTSLSDGASISLIEAMACGLPVVVSDIPGNREWVKNGKNGFLVPVKDPTALAEKIVFLLKNDDLRRLLGDNNSELAMAKADWTKNVNVLYRCIEALAAA